MTMPTVLRRALVTVIVLLVLVISQRSALTQANDWLEPFPPFRIAGNLYYVGSRGLASYLVATSEGHILINSDLEANVPMLRASIEKLGFKYKDVKILLISHAHWDHNAGSALIKKQTGAKYMVMAEDVPAVESGGRTDFQYGTDKSTYYRPTKVDRTLRDKDEVKLGDAALVAHLTAGHTKGCTTWTMKVKDGARIHDAVIVCSPNVNPGYKLVNNAAYPGIADDYARMFQTLMALPCDLFLGAHGSYYNLDAKYARMQKGDANAFVDPVGYRRFVADKSAEFQTELKKQRGR
jgi:metallo-beta-lactamase class B